MLSLVAVVSGAKSKQDGASTCKNSTGLNRMHMTNALEEMLIEINVHQCA